jgi:hypothetical protein
MATLTAKLKLYFFDSLSKSTLRRPTLSRRGNRPRHRPQENRDGIPAAGSHRSQRLRTAQPRASSGNAGALKNAGVLRASNRLRPASSATIVKVKSGKTDVLNGPYVETREELGGYFLIDVKDLDAALSWAARCPAASHGAVEVRPVWAMGEA